MGEPALLLALALGWTATVVFVWLGFRPGYSWTFLTVFVVTLGVAYYRRFAPRIALRYFLLMLLGIAATSAVVLVHYGNLATPYRLLSAVVGASTLAMFALVVRRRKRRAA